jgi:hypothetical protein
MITYDRLVRLDTVEQILATKVSSAIEVDVTVDCAPAGRTVIVNAPGAAHRVHRGSTLPTRLTAH